MSANDILEHEEDQPICYWLIAFVCALVLSIGFATDIAQMVAVLVPEDEAPVCVEIPTKSGWPVVLPICAKP